MVASCTKEQERHLVTHLQIQSTGLWGKQYFQETDRFQLGHGGEWNHHKERIKTKVILQTMNGKSKS